MAFMEKQVYSGTYYVVETENGTDFIPEDVCGSLRECLGTGVMYETPADDDAECLPIWAEWVRQVKDYASGKEIRTISRESGNLYRLSAPGYMDCTDWTTDADSPEFDDDGE